MRSVLCVAVAALVISAPARAEQRYRFDIPPGSLQQAIIALARQANVSIALADPSLSRVTVRRVAGTMTVAEAFNRLLADAPARAVPLGDSTYRVVRVRSARPMPTPRAPDPSPPVPTAPPQPQPEREEIIVTGSKRGTPLRDYPGPATILRESDFTVGSGAEGTAAIFARVPSLGSTHLGTGRNKLFVRAIADSSFNGPTQSTVGQYLGEVRVNYNAPDPDLRLYDIEAVELLPGPQGTLYGSGSMGGVLRIVPKAPDPADASATMIASGAATAHGEPSGELAAIANLPLSRDAAIRTVAYGVSEGGYIDDVGIGERDVNRTQVVGGRAAFGLSLSNDWQIDAGIAGQSIDGDGSQYALRSEPRLTRRSNFRQPFSNEYLLGHVTVRRQWADYWLIAAFSAVDQELSESFDATQVESAPELFRQRNRLAMQALETRLTRDWSNGGGWLAGISLVHNRAQLDRALGSADALLPLPGVLNRLNEQTVFAEVTQPLADGLGLTGGARLSHIRFEGLATGPSDLEPGPPSRISGEEWRLLPSLALGARIAGGTQVYVRYQESSRPGGAIVRTNATQRLESDHISAWEAGFRFGQQAGADLTGTLSFAYSRWTDVQADLVDTSGLPSTINLGDGDIWSIDGAVAWRPSPELRFGLATVFNRSRVSNPDPGIIFIQNERLPNVPDASATASIDYSRWLGSRELQLTLRARYVGTSTLGIGPILGLKQGDYLDTSAEARITNAQWDTFVAATNLLDSIGNRFALGSVLRLVEGDQTTPLRPRTLRVGLRRRF